MAVRSGGLHLEALLPSRQHDDRNTTLMPHANGHPLSTLPSFPLTIASLYTRTAIDHVDYLGRWDVSSSTDINGVALGGGGGTGLDLRMYQQETPAAGNVRTVSLHLGVQYLSGKIMESLPEAALADTNENGRLDAGELDGSRSRTMFLRPQFGLTIQFTGCE